MLPNGVIVVEFSVPVTALVAFVPAAVTVCVCVPIALPVNVGWVNVPAPIVGTPAGHATVPPGAPVIVVELAAPEGLVTAPPPVCAAVPLEFVVNFVVVNADCVIVCVWAGAAKVPKAPE